MSPRPLLLGLAALASLSACDKGGKQAASANAGTGTVDVPQTVTAEVPGTTPMGQRVAVLGFLNKRNGLSQDITLKPGQAARIGDAIVRLRACETTASWEAQRLTGAFVQLDVKEPRDRQDRYRRVFSGWLYKETPSLNAVQHPIYDVWPKSCAMTHPEAGPSTVRAGSAASSRSSAPNSAPARRPTPSSPGAPSPPPVPSGAPADSADSNSAR
jgi:hypothetical protein